MPILLLIVGINFIGVGALIPVLPYVVIELLGLPASVMTFLLASFAFAMFIANPILGRLSDHFGRRRVLVLSLCVSVAAHLWFAFSTDIYMLFAARIISGFASGSTGVIQAMIVERTKPRERAQYLGLLGAAVGVGFVAGPVIGGLLSDFGGGPAHQTPFMLASLFSLIALVMCRLLKPAPDAQRIPIDERRLARAGVIIGVLRSPLAPYAMVSLALNLSFAQVEASFVLVLRDYLGYGVREAGWFFAYFGVCLILVQAVLIRHIVALFGEVGSIALGGVLLLCGQILTVMAVLGFLPVEGFPLAKTIIATTALGFGFAITAPALSAASSNVASATAMGGSLGMIQGFGSLGQVVGLVIAGPFYDLGGSHIPFGFGAVISLGMVALTPLLVRTLVTGGKRGGGGG